MLDLKLRIYANAALQQYLKSRKRWGLSRKYLRDRRGDGQVSCHRTYQTGEFGLIANYSVRGGELFHKSEDKKRRKTKARVLILMCLPQRSSLDGVLIKSQRGRKTKTRS